MTVCNTEKSLLSLEIVGARRTSVIFPTGTCRPRSLPFNRVVKPALVDLLRAAARYEQPDFVPANSHPAAGIHVVPTAALLRQRRSLAATEMYMLNMLHFQKSAKSAELASVIGCGSDQAFVMDALLNALHYLLTISSMGQGTRIAEHFAELVPEIALAEVANVVARRLSPNLAERAA